MCINKTTRKNHAQCLNNSAITSAIEMGKEQKAKIGYKKNKSLQFWEIPEQH